MDVEVPSPDGSVARPTWGGRTLHLQIADVVGGVFDAPDPVAAVHAYRRCFD